MSEILLQRDAAAQVLVGGSYAAYAALEWLATRRGRRRTEQPAVVGRHDDDRGTKMILLVALFGGIALAWQAAVHLQRLAFGNEWLWLGIGLAVFWAGAALRLWAIASLGRFFRRDVVVQAGHAVVRSGPYRVLRHPAYAGTILVAAGLGLTLANPVAFVLLVATVLIGHLRRIAVEEAALERELGDDYRRYEGETARLVPRIW